MERRNVGRAMAVLGVATAVGVSPAAGQGIDGQVGRFYEDGGWDVYRLGVSRPIAGILGLGLNGNYLRRADGGDGG